VSTYYAGSGLSDTDDAPQRRRLREHPDLDRRGQIGRRPSTPIRVGRLFWSRLLGSFSHGPIGAEASRSPRPLDCARPHGTNLDTLSRHCDNTATKCGRSARLRNAEWSYRRAPLASDKFVGEVVPHVAVEPLCHLRQEQAKWKQSIARRL